MPLGFIGKDLSYYLNDYLLLHVGLNFRASFMSEKVTNLFPFHLKLFWRAKKNFDQL